MRQRLDLVDNQHTLSIRRLVRLMGLMAIYSKKNLSKFNNIIDNQIDIDLIKLSQEELTEPGNGLLVLQKLCSFCNGKNNEPKN